MDNNLIDEIRAHVNIVDIISSYLPLTKKGKNYFGVCPFHDDHSPSMSVSEEKQIFTCFSCGASGNVFKFLQDYENISFLESVKKCADISGISFSYGAEKKYNKNQDLLDMYLFASKLYQNNLYSSLGKEAREYLNTRKIDDEIIKEFQIGLALNEPSILTDALKKKYDDKRLLSSGLISEGLAYDTGDYIKGDITPGEYAFVKFDGSGSYYSEEDAAGNIIDNENFDSFGYVKVHGVGSVKTRGVLVNINAFERLNVTGAKQLYEILNNQKNYNQGGYYKVGTDIEPGQYLLESIGGSGYWAIMTGPVGNSDIVNNDNYSGRASVNLRTGQYITISRSTITKQS